MPIMQASASTLIIDSRQCTWAWRLLVLRATEFATFPNRGVHAHEERSVVEYDPRGSSFAGGGTAGRVMAGAVTAEELMAD